MIEGKEKNEQDTFVIPDKYRKVGNPYGTYIVYIEDYVHTLIKQYLSRSQREISLYIYGKICKYEERYYIFIHVATIILNEFDDDTMKETFLGEMKVIGKEKKDNSWKITLNLLGDINCAVDSYYIYYEKNEVMQNYLIQWHEKNEEMNDPEETEIMVKYARALQDKTHYMVNESREKQFFSVICFSFLIVLCVMAITIINNYHKMLELQDNITYISEHISDIPEQEMLEKAVAYLQNTKSVETTGQDVTLNNQENPYQITIEETEENTDFQSETETEKSGQDVVQESIEQTTEETIENNQPTDSNEEQMPEESEENIETAEDTESLNEKEVTITYQVYTVQEGDSLRKIVLEQYHSLNRLEEICLLNQIDEPDEIWVGQEIYLP